MISMGDVCNVGEWIDLRLVGNGCEIQAIFELRCK